MDKILLFLLLFCCAFLLYAFYAVRAETGTAFSLHRLTGYLVRTDGDNWQAGILLQGVFMTLRVSFWCLFIALVTGSFVGIVSARKKGISALPGKLYVLSLRNMPPLILLFLIFFFASSILTEFLFGVEYAIAKSACKDWFYLFIAPQGQLDRMIACILTLGLYEGAYVAEIVRAGIESVSRGQWEAGRATGLSDWQIRRCIVAPQALRQSLAPLAGQGISTIKDSAIASIISLQELTFQSMELMNVTGNTLDLWLLTALLYFLLCFCLEKASLKWEQSIQWKSVQ